MKIAQQFIAGEIGVGLLRVPEGRLKLSAMLHRSAVPPGLPTVINLVSTDKSVGYYRSSLREEDR